MFDRIYKTTAKNAHFVLKPLKLTEKTQKTQRLLCITCKIKILLRSCNSLILYTQQDSNSSLIQPSILLYFGLTCPHFSQVHS